MLKDFKAFIMKGNVLDLAVAVIIGGAFGAIVTSMVNDIIMPPIGMILGHIDFKDLFVNLNGQSYASLAAAKAAGAPVIAYGQFLNTAINFLIIAFVVFIAVRAVGKLQKAAMPRSSPAPASRYRPPRSARSVAPPFRFRRNGARSAPRTFRHKGPGRAGFSLEGLAELARIGGRCGLRSAFVPGTQPVYCNPTRATLTPRTGFRPDCNKMKLRPGRCEASRRDRQYPYAKHRASSYIRCDLRWISRKLGRPGVRSTGNHGLGQPHRHPHRRAPL